MRMPSPSQEETRRERTGPVPSPLLHPCMPHHLRCGPIELCQGRPELRAFGAQATGGKTPQSILFNQLKLLPQASKIAKPRGVPGVSSAKLQPRRAPAPVLTRLRGGTVEQHPEILGCETARCSDLW